jgi:peptidoglycan/LPS O-acetylase OafA/YrhL
LTGGYIGVDIFFVISGFLISGQLARELTSSGKIALATFWAKRVRRLVPASLVVLIVSIIVTAVVMPLAYVHESLWDIAASALYVQNWHLVANSVNYLASEGHTIAEHYWSLSLEEQFYVVWPLILLATFASGARLSSRRRGLLLASVVVVVGVLSLAASIYFTSTNPGQAYFMLFTRMWEFAAGALLVFIPRLMPAQAWVRNMLGLGGLITIFASAVVLTAE